MALHSFQLKIPRLRQVSNSFHSKVGHSRKYPFFSPPSKKWAGLMISALTSGSSSSGLIPGPGTFCCVLGPDTSLTVPLFTQVCKWVPANLTLGATLRWTSIPSRREEKYSRNATEIQEKLWPDEETLPNYADLTYLPSANILPSSWLWRLTCDVTRHLSVTVPMSESFQATKFKLMNVQDNGQQERQWFKVNLQCHML